LEYTERHGRYSDKGEVMIR